MFGSNLPRPVPSVAAEDAESCRFTVWYDVLGIDSPYDYDPVWAKCVELGIAPTFHSGSSSQGLRLSPTNFVYNHIGRARRREGDFSRRRDPALPAAQLRLS